MKQGLQSAVEVMSAVEGSVGSVWGFDQVRFICQSLLFFVQLKRGLGQRSDVSALVAASTTLHNLDSRCGEAYLS